MTNGYHHPQRPAKKTQDSQKAQAEKPKSKDGKPAAEKRNSERK